jgi:hypothetical protein
MENLETLVRVAYWGTKEQQFRDLKLIDCFNKAMELSLPSS